VKVGDLVEIVSKNYWPDTLGVIVDIFDATSDGFCEYEVMVSGECEWFSDVELRVITHDDSSSAVPK